MAVVTVKSTEITNRDTSPPVYSNARINGGQVRHSRGVVTITSGDTTASKYLVLSLPSNAMPVSVRVSSPDIGTTTIADVGLYKSTEEGGAVADADFFASALSLKDGALSKSEIIRESGVITIANSQKQLWEHLGLSADPFIWYDVAFTLTADADATGTVLLEVDYTI